MGNFSLCVLLSIFLIGFASCDKDSGVSSSRRYRISDNYGNYGYISGNDSGDDSDNDDDDDNNNDDYGGDSYHENYENYDDQDSDSSDYYSNYNDDDENDDDDDDDNDKYYMSSSSQYQKSVVCAQGVRFIRHPTDCSKFYQCASGRPFLITCPAGLKFNENLEICDWPSSVDCSDGGNSDSGEEDYGSDNGYFEKGSKGSSTVYTAPAHTVHVYRTGNPPYYRTNQYGYGTSYTRQGPGQPQTGYPQQRQPQYVTHYHYEYQPSQSKTPQRSNRVTHSRRQKGGSGTRSGQVNYSKISDAFSNLLMAMSAMTPSWSRSQSNMMTYPNQQQMYPHWMGYQNNMQTPSMTRPVVSHHHYGQSGAQVTKGDPVVVHHPVHHYYPRQSYPSYKGQGSVKGDYYVDYDNSGTKGDVYYVDYETDDTGSGGRFWKGDNFVQSYVDQSIYSKNKFQGGALYNPQFFGKAFKGLNSKRNLVHHYHHKHHPMQGGKYYHHNHHGYTKGGGVKGEGGDDLLNTMLLLSPGGLQTVLLSKLLGSFQGEKFKGNTKGGLLENILLMRLLSGNTNNGQTTPTSRPAPATVVLDRNNRILRLDTRQPVNLIDSTTGLNVLPANAAVLPSGAIVDVTTGRPLVFVNPATGALVPAIVAVNVATSAPATIAARSGAVRNLVPTTSQNEVSRQGINLIFLSPLTPSSLPPPLINNDGSATYIQGAIRQLLGNDLARFLNKPTASTQTQSITSAAGRDGRTCAVVRNGQTVPFQMPPQNGRRLTSSECRAMGKLLDKFVPTFLQNFVPSEVAAAGLGRSTVISNGNLQQAVRTNVNLGGVGQQLPALSPASVNFRPQLAASGRSWNSINDYITVQNDVTGCTISVPSITPRC